MSCFFLMCLEILSLFVCFLWALSLIPEVRIHSPTGVYPKQELKGRDGREVEGGRQNSEKAGKVPRTSGHNPFSLGVGGSHEYDGTSPP